MLQLHWHLFGQAVWCCMQCCGFRTALFEVPTFDLLLVPCISCWKCCSAADSFVLADISHMCLQPEALHCRVTGSLQ